MSLLATLGIDLPIIQAPMAGVSSPALAAAVANAGALGSIGVGATDADGASKMIAEVRARSNRSLNVNVFCHRPPQADVAREAAWLEHLRPQFAKFGAQPPAGLREIYRSFLDDDAMLTALVAARPRVVSFHFGLPSPELIDRVRAWGAKILSSATTVEEARWLEAHGVDAVIAQGVEAGGHRGMFLTDDVSTQVTTMALVPQVVKAVSIPVIAAGGIADASGVRAAIDLGASGVQVGTSYLLCPEATTSALHRAALASDASRHTALTNLFTGRPARAIVNRLMRELRPMSSLPPAFPLAASAIAPLKARAESRGVTDCSSMWAGQNTSGCREIPAADLTRALAEGLS